MRKNRFKIRLIALGAAALCGLSLQHAEAANILKSANIVASEAWRPDHDNDGTLDFYIITQPIYVTNGATLTILPGTVVRGEPQSMAGANDPGTLIIARDAKIQACGTKENPIVFTDLNDNNLRGNPGTAPYDTLANALGTTAQWGGVILLGRTYVARDSGGATPTPNPAREHQIEGLTAVGGLGLYGNCSADASPPLCDDDDSGTLCYISIRYGGFNLSANNEINGLTLGGVGRETDIQYVEVLNNKDDGFEMFGGTVNLKNIIVANSGDDSIDYDQGYRGKIQFAFVVQGTPGTDKSDKGGEFDGGENPPNSAPRTIPTFYNFTFVGLGQKTYTNKARNTGMQFRENAGGRVYNSFFADFGGRTLCIEGGVLPGGSSTAADTSGERSVTAYNVTPPFYLDPDSDFELELQDNNFWCFGSGSALPTGDGSSSGCTNVTAGVTNNYHDNGAFTNLALDNDYFDCVSTLPIRTLTRTAVAPATQPDPITAVDPRPRPGSGLLTTDRTPPSGFFGPAPYKGAFTSGVNWALGWSTMYRLGYFPTCGVANPLAIPDEVSSLIFNPPVSNKSNLSWSAQTFNTTSYDVLRSTDPSNFTTGTSCVESNDVNTSASDASVPALGQCFYYLVRANNNCGEGSLGLASNAAERAGRICP